MRSPNEIGLQAKLLTSHDRRNFFAFFSQAYLAMTSHRIGDR